MKNTVSFTTIARKSEVVVIHSFKGVLWSVQLLLEIRGTQGDRSLSRPLGRRFCSRTDAAAFGQAVRRERWALLDKQLLIPTDCYPTASVKLKNQAWLSYEIKVKNCLWKCKERKGWKGIWGFIIDIGLEKTMKGSSIDGDDWHPYGKCIPVLNYLYYLRGLFF